MSGPPNQPRIYHITHVKNLRQITEEGALLSDAEMTRRGGPPQGIGMSEIKRRRIDKRRVSCHPGTMVGDYVPFNFCPRSVMLYVIFRGNTPGLDFKGGQEPILHLESDLEQVIDWAQEQECQWALSSSNAGSAYAEFYCSRQHVERLDWDAIASNDFRRPEVKEGKQAEFLLHGRFPFELVRRIGVGSHGAQQQVLDCLRASEHRPPVEVQPDWYFPSAGR